MEKLIVVDNSSDVIEVHEYNVDPDTDITGEYIEKLGFDISYCAWFFGARLHIVKHKGTLK